MTNKTFESEQVVGLLEITKQLANSAQAHVDRGRKQVADLEDRLHSALDAKRDVASEYSRQLQDTIKRNDSMWKAGYDVGYAEGYNAGRLHGELPLNEETVHDEHLKSLNSMTEDEISQELADAGYDVDELVESVQQTIKDHENKVTKDDQN